MALDRSSFSLFGLDLAGVYEHWRQGWAEALRWPFFVRLLSAETVRMLLADGREHLVRPDGGQVHGGKGVSLAVAVVLPDDIVLQGRLQLPPMSAMEQAQAVTLAVQGASPFPLDDIVWGYRVDGTGSGAEIEYALAARTHVQACLDSRRHVLDGTNPEVWVMGRLPIVLRGFGEGARLGRERRARLKLAGLAAAALVLVLALLASPVLQLRQQVFDAQARFEALTREVAPVVADREVLGKANTQLQIVGEYLQARPDPRRVLARLTELLPDSVYLTRFEIRGRTVVIGGLAQNAASLMELLGAQPEFREVRAPAAISLDRATGRESFTVEFRLVENGGAQP